jgi:flagellar protein FliO/FliZ
MKFSSIFSLGLISLLYSGKAIAQTIYPAADSLSGSVSYGPSMVGVVMKLLLSMVLIVGLIYLSMHFLKKLNTRSAKGEVLGDFVKVLNRTFIAPKQSLLVVKMGEKYAILGVTENNINMISEVSPEEIEKLKNVNRTGDGSSRQKFTDIFKGMIKP